jgi:DNA-binding beta-propeller fold protein YncE
MKRFLWLGFVLSLYLICTGCGETFRPIIIPNPPVFPNPRAAHSVLSINDNGDVVAGSAMAIDVSGDTDQSVANVAIHPVHAVQQTASQVLVLNQAVTPATVGNLPTTSCLVTFPPTPPNQVFNVCPSVAKLSFNGTSITGVTTLSLPIYSGSNFVAVAPLDTLAYVTMPTYPPDPTAPQTIVPSVGVISTLGNPILAATIPVGNNPVALAVTPDTKKLYVANEGNNTVSGFNTVDRSQRTGSPAATSSAPIWLVARTDNQRVYILEKSGVLAQLDTTSTAGPDTLTEFPAISVPTATTMTYDVNLNRLYIPGGDEVAIVDVSQPSPVLITGAAIAIPTVAPGLRAAFDPCSQTSAQTLTVAAVAALPDGSRAYVGAYYTDGSGNLCPQATVIDVPSSTVKTSIPIPGFPDATIPSSQYYVPVCVAPTPPTPYRATFRINMAAGGDSTRAYLASCDGGNVNIIDTSNDTYILNLPAPVGTRPPIPPAAQNPPQNPVFLLAGP